MQYTWPGHFSIFLLTDARRKYLRRRHGDLLGSAVFERDNRQPLIWASFRSILQGDHAGVEIATAAHSQLLKDYGLLHQDSQLKASSPCFSCGFAEGLVIDDYFAVSIDDRGVEACESGDWCLCEWQRPRNFQRSVSCFCTAGEEASLVFSYIASLLPSLYNSVIASLHCWSLGFYSSVQATNDEFAQ